MISSLLGDLERSGHIRVLDLFPVFCPGETCGYTDADGVLLYRDEFSHASVDAARRARPIVRDWLEEIAP